MGQEAELMMQRQVWQKPDQCIEEKQVWQKPDRCIEEDIDYGIQTFYE